MTTEQPARRTRPMVVIIVALPLCLAISVVGAVWWHWHSETAEEADPALALANEGMSRGEVADLVRKLGWLNADGWESEAGRKGIAQRIALIDGTLSPQNYGFVVKRGAGVAYEGDLWPMLWVDVRGGEREDEVLVVSAPYDGDDGSVVALLTAAKEWRDSKPERTIRILFHPQALFLGNERRGDFLAGGEELVAVLNLERLGAEGGGGAAALEVGGPALAGLEPLLDLPAVERRIGDELPGTAAVFGARGAAVHQVVRPADPDPAAATGPQDPELLMGRAAVLVELVTRLASAGG